MSIRHNLYQDNDRFYSNLDKLKINNFQSEFLNLPYPIHIYLSNAQTHDEYIKDAQSDKFLEYLYIRDDHTKKSYKIKNNNYLKFYN